ncbi:MAG: energy transducer TonB [Myxococcales bacterium]|nr:energy transducer TonB [Myxococcales bacterium]
MRAAPTVCLLLALAACDAPAPEPVPPSAPAPVAPPPAPVAPPPAGPPPATPAPVASTAPPSPSDDPAARRQAALALLSDGRGAAALPLVDTSPGLEHDPQLADKLTPREYLDRMRMPLVRQAKSTVEGPLDKDIIRRVVRAHINEIRRCYNQGLALEPTLAGRVVVEFTVRGDGSVRDSAVTSSTINDADVDACIAAAARRWRFPRPERDEPVTVAYPFVFAPG